jgi:hypothetical protein
VFHLVGIYLTQQVLGSIIFEMPKLKAVRVSWAGDHAVLYETHIQLKNGHQITF